MVFLKPRIVRSFSVLICILLFVFLLRLCFSFFASKKDTYIDVSKNKIYQIETSRNHDFFIYGKHLLMVSNEKITCINNHGGVVWEDVLSFNNPVVKTAGSYVVIAEQNGTRIMLVSKGSVLCEFDSSGSIFTVDVNHKGFFTVVDSESGYRNKLSVYNSSGRLIYTWKISDSYVLTSDVSGNGRYLAVSMVDTSQTGMRGILSLVDMHSASVVFREEFDNRLYLSVIFDSRNVFSAVGDIDSVCFSTNGKLIWSIDYEDRQLQAFSHRKGENFVLAFHNGSNTSTIESYSPSGVLRGSRILDFSISKLDSKGNKIISSSESRIVLTNHRCDVKKKLTLSGDFYWCGISENGFSLFLVSGSSIVNIKI